MRLGVKTLGSPVAESTSHLSLQYAYLTPAPLMTFLRKVALQTPSVCCVHELSHLPGGDQLSLSESVDRGRKDWQFDSLYCVLHKKERNVDRQAVAGAAAAVKA